MALHRLNVLDTLPDAELDEVVALVARLFDVPTALVSLVASNRQWFKAKVGVTETETAREVAFCDHTIRQRGVLLVEDAAKDPRFRDNPSVIGAPYVRFYAGAPLVTSDEAAVGTLCVLGPEPRSVSAYQQAMLVALADRVVRRLEGRERTGGAGELLPADSPMVQAADLGVGLELGHVHRLLRDSSLGYVQTTADGVITVVNAAAAAMFGYSPSELVGRSAGELAHPDHAGDSAAGLESFRLGLRSGYEATRFYRHSDGRTVPVQSTVSFVPASAEAPASIGALLVDLSPRLYADAHWLTAERDRSRVLEAATDAYIALDREGLVTEWNPAAARIFGFGAQEAVSRNLAELIIPADQRAAHAAGLQRVMAGEGSRMVGRSFEVVAEHRDGHALQIELTPWEMPGTDGGSGTGFCAFARDVGERAAARAALVDANRALRQSQEQLRAAFEASFTADALVDGAGVIVDVNPQMCRFLRRSREELVGHGLVEFVFAPDVSDAQAALARVALCTIDRSELRFVTADEQVVWGLVSLRAMAAGEEPAGAVLRIENLQQYKDLEGALLRQSTHDEVTGLPNRALFLERARQCLLDRETGTAVAALVLRVDGLRDLIDRSGFAAADTLLSTLAEQLAVVTPDGVTLAHLVPGLFAALVPAGSSAGTQLAERYLSAAATLLPTALSGTSLRVSIGISSAAPRDVSEATRTARLVQDAENAARQASADGGNTIFFASQKLREAQQRQHELEAVIRHALDQQQVQVAYQPVVDLTTGAIVGVEALLRLDDLQGRPVSALEVVTAAEACGLIVDLGRRVLQIAAAQVARWQHDHGRIVPAAVNVSAVQLRRGSFRSHVMEALHDAELPAQALTLELTESVLLASGSTGMEQLLALRDAGVHLAIDDFGTGYASLTYLRDLPATTLKIDRSFVAGIPHDLSAMAIVRGVLDLATSFGMTCIAEGIETEAQREYLAGRHVLGQGYLLARPTNPATISRLIAQHGRAPDPGGSGGPGMSVADARDQAGLRRDTAGQERDHLGNERDQVGDLRDQVGDQRDLVADRRDQAGDRRDHAADLRDDLAEERDREGIRRDQAAGHRDLEQQHAASTTAGDTDGHSNRQSRLFHAARSDRERASRDRQAGADERALAGQDRSNALADRGAGARERQQAEQDRSTSAQDRDHGAGERTSSHNDRDTAHADRGASARDRDQSFIDALTGAQMRRPGLANLAREIARSNRTGQPLTVAFVDVDGLKAINDHHGHHVGDQALQAVAKALQTSLRSYDLIIRYGGDEFLCAMPGLAPTAAAERLDQATRTLAATPPAPAFTAGLTQLQADDTTDTIIARADANLYQQRNHTHATHPQEQPTHTSRDQ